MINIEDIEVTGWESAVRGMRNPLNSWDKSDSDYIITPLGLNLGFSIGGADLDLMKRLAKAGSDHAKYRRFINVTADITAPLYWWKEYDTYKVGTVANSCSTMHKIQAKEFTLDDFSHEYLNCDSLHLLSGLIKCLNVYREEFINTKDKGYWWQMIQLLPNSYNQRRTVQLNYEVLANIYHSRCTHKLDEWRDFCKCIESLPYSELITGGDDSE